MITEHDLQEAIAECEGQRNPTANTCIKLAAFYTIKQHMFPDENTNYSYSSGKLDLNQSSQASQVSQANYGVITYDSGSEFSKLINGGDINRLLEIIDDVMETLSVVNPRFYNSIMNRLSEI